MDPEISAERCHEFVPEIDPVRDAAFVHKGAQGEDGIQHRPAAAVLFCSQKDPFFADPAADGAFGFIVVFCKLPQLAGYIAYGQKAERVEHAFRMPPSWAAPDTGTSFSVVQKQPRLFHQVVVWSAETGLSSAVGPYRPGEESAQEV